MPAIVPHRFLFRYSLPVRHVPRMPKAKGARLLDLPEKCRLPLVDELAETPAFAELRAGWNSGGLGFELLVRGKKRPTRGDADAPTEADGLQVWIDTRNTQSVHRATRFCHHFCLLPGRGDGVKVQPIARQLPIARARDDAPLCEPSEVKLALERLDDGYRLEAWLPADVLLGYDPETSPLLGFYYHVRDAELGDQFLSVGHEFPFAYDPSLWATLELVQG